MPRLYSQRQRCKVRSSDFILGIRKVVIPAIQEIQPRTSRRSGLGLILATRLRVQSILGLGRLGSCFKEATWNVTRAFTCASGLEMWGTRFTPVSDYSQDSI